MTMQRQKDQSGVISLLALILMATVTATAVGSSVLVVNELRQSQSLDESLSAAYAAEAGIEDGLYVVKAKRPIDTLANAKTALDSNAYRGSFSNFAAWSRTADTEDTFVVNHLRPDQTATLDLFNPDDATGAFGMQSLLVKWNDDCGGQTWLETTVLTWEASSALSFDPATQRVFKQTNACVNATGHCVDIPLNGLEGHQFQATHVYRLGFRALATTGASVNCSVENLSVKVYPQPNQAGIPIPLPARVVVKSTGSYARSKQALNATVPWRAPVSGLLNFVIFSEEPIEK